MISFSLTNIKGAMSHLLLRDTFDKFSFIEGEIVTFNTFRIDGFIQKNFFDTGSELPEYSSWKDIREYCLYLIKGKRTPLNFHFVLSLSPVNIRRLISQSAPFMDVQNVRGLYLNISYDGNRLNCVTGTSFKTFVLDKTLEHIWDETAEIFFRQHEIDYEKD